MDAVLCRRFRPEEYHRRFLEQGLRPDGRAARERRRCSLQRGPVTCAHGSASVRLGRSAAVAGVRAEVAEAVQDTPARGLVTVSVELPRLCAAAFRDRQRTAGVSAFLSSALSEVLGSPDVLDPLQLDIREDELCWCLHVSVVCVSYDGNAFDLCLLAALAALEDTSLPALALAGGPQPEGVPGRLCEAAPGSQEVVSAARRVRLKARPLPVTFARLPGDAWVLDPSAAEEELGASASLCLLGERWRVCHQGGGAGAERFLSELMPAAREAAAALEVLLDGSGPEDC